MLRYGILSTASITERFVQGINESENAIAYAIASRDINRAKQLATKLNIEHYYGSYEELYNDENIDIIYIPVMNSLHYETTKQALLHHKHVVVEKPFTLHSLQAIELFNLAKQNNCFLMEVQKSVFLPTTIRLKELINNNTIGKIKYIELKAGFPGRFDYNHWMYQVKNGGGALYGSATYTIEYLSYLFDTTFDDIEGTCIKAPTNSDDICNFQLKIDSILVSSTIAMNVALKNEAVFYGDKGYIVVPLYWKARGLEIHINDEIIEEKFPCTSEFVYEINHIQSCIDNHLIESPIMNQERTIMTTKLVEQLYQQWK